MRPLLKFFSILVGLALFLLSEPSLALESVMQASGEAYIFLSQEQRAKKQAHFNAKREIVEKAVRQLLHPEDVINNWKELQNKILSQPENYLKEVDILQEEIADLYKVSLQSKVDVSKIKEDLLKHHIIFQSSQYVRVFLLYHPTRKDSFDLDSRLVQDAFHKAPDYLMDFQVKYDMELNRRLIRQNLETVFNNLKRKGIFLIVLFDIYPVEQKEEDFLFQKQKLAVAARAFTLDRENIVKKTIESSIYSNAQKLSRDWYQALDFLAANEIELLFSYMNYNMKEYFRQDSEQSQKYELQFVNFSEQEWMKLKDILSNMEEFLSMDEAYFSGNKIEVVYFSFLNKKVLQNLLFQRAEDLGITLITKSDVPEGFVFIKPGSE